MLLRLLLLVLLLLHVVLLLLLPLLLLLCLLLLLLALAAAHSVISKHSNSTASSWHSTKLTLPLGSCSVTQQRDLPTDATSHSCTLLAALQERVLHSASSFSTLFACSMQRDLFSTGTPLLVRRSAKAFISSNSCVHAALEGCEMMPSLAATTG
jgi:hypothetical protein